MEGDTEVGTRESKVGGWAGSGRRRSGMGRHVKAGSGRRMGDIKFFNDILVSF